MDPKLLKQYEDELIARVAARDHLTEWIKYRDVGLVPARHHQLIIDELEKVESVRCCNDRRFRIPPDEPRRELN